MKRLDTVAIIGVGLIGGSIGLALRRRDLARQVVGIGRRRTSLDAARRKEAVTATTMDIAKGVSQAELVVVCTPVGRIVEHAREAARHCPPGILITDAGSTKAEIVSQLDGDLGRGVRFLGSHPLAGGEKKGPAQAEEDLFEGRIVILTPGPASRAEDRDTLAQFWKKLGAEVLEMSPEVHDRALAATSHLPHLVASALAAAAPTEYARLVATGWLDSTRIAAGDPDLWRQILSINRVNVLEWLTLFETRLASFRAALERGDEVQLEKLLTEAKRIRDALGS
jgi:prephenate dehydrogenase